MTRTRAARAACIAALATPLALTLFGCSQYASVSKKRPEFRAVRGSASAPHSVERRIVDALRRERREPLLAMGELLTAAETASRELLRNPNDTAARDAYNFAVARVFTAIDDGKLDPWNQPLRLPAAGGDFVLTHKPDRRHAWNPALYDFTPADQFHVKGTYVTSHTQKPGIGAPLVAVGREANQNAQADNSLPRLVYGVTAIIRFHGRRAVVSFEDPLATERVTFGGRSFPLAADFTGPLAVMLASTNPKKLELMRLLRPEKYAETARIARLEPYNPN
ncbi:MAG TPA: hypothetical protein VFV83_08120, partial [Chthoniobacteraceae bacterium]|nr:hypothetical protein [Chthoniobacteraceae bacterium]